MKIDEIAGVSGKPGLYKIVKPGKRMIILESMTDGKKFPFYKVEKVSPLNRVSLFTLEGEMELPEVFYRMHSSEVEPVNYKSGDRELMGYLEQVLPEYDRESVYPSHVKKLIQWYGILRDAGFDFESLNPELKDDEQNQDDE